MLLIGAAAAMIVPAISARIKRASAADSWANVPALIVTPQHPSFLDATRDLANVRKRLLSTGHLDDDQREAIDTLQLALTSGSDEE